MGGGADVGVLRVHHIPGVVRKRGSPYFVTIVYLQFKGVRTSSILNINVLRSLFVGSRFHTKQKSWSPMTNSPPLIIVGVISPFEIVGRSFARCSSSVSALSMGGRRFYEAAFFHVILPGSLLKIMRRPCGVGSEELPTRSMNVESMCSKTRLVKIQRATDRK